MDSHSRGKNITRRQALARLGMVSVVAYVVPEMVMLSQARASSGASLPSVPTPPTPPTAPSNIDELEYDKSAVDRCQGSGASGRARPPTFSRRDFERARASVQAGYAKPLTQIWGDIVNEYGGRILGIEFTGYRWRPRYRLRAISRTGRLETIIVSARTGLIVRIVGC